MKHLDLRKYRIALTIFILVAISSLFSAVLFIVTNSDANIFIPEGQAQIGFENNEFETINFGSLGGTNLGSIQAALRGVIPVDLENDDDDPNLRFSSDTNSRVTKSEIFRLGGEWQGEKWSVFAEVASTSSDTTTPSFNTTLNFINPNAPLDAGGANDNAVPFAYDLSGGALTFGIADGAEYAPTAEQLLDPNNVVLRDVNIGRDTTENFEDAFRVDFTYYVDTMVTSVDFGYRYNKSGSKREEIGNNVNLRSMEDSPRGSLFSELLVAGPDNFNDADGRELYVADFLLIDPEQVSSNPDAVLAALQQALETHGSGETLDEPTSSSTGFFDIEEETHALYAQANFEYEMFRGNFGVRYLQTDVTSVGNSVTVDENGDELVSRVTNNGDYDFILPRFNLVADVTDDIVLRFGAGKDIRRPNFNDLSTSVTFSTSPNPNVAIGNPNLTPEEVISYDLAAEWYFAEASVISVGIFHKTRKDLFVDQIVSAAEDPVTGYRDLTDPCEGGGIFNPIADINVFGPNLGTGVCVGTETKINDTGETTQKGIEFAVQYDLSGFESELGWASGFGVLANYTIQEFDGGEAENIATSRAGQVFAATTGNDQEVSAVQGLLNLSETLPVVILPQKGSRTRSPSLVV